MSLKDGNGNIYKIYKGNAKPVNLYRNGEQLAGYTEMTLRGEDITFENTYEDNFSNIKICGGFIQEGVTEPKAESLSIAEPTFASDYEVTFKEGTIEIPKVITLDDGTEVDAELKGVRNLEGDISHYDYIEVSGGVVKLYNFIHSADISRFTYTSFQDKPKSSAFCCYIQTYNTIKATPVKDVGLCNALTLGSYLEVQYNNAGIPYGVYVGSGRIYISIKCADAGIESGATPEERTVAFNNWIGSMADNGTPIILWYAVSTPKITDITNSDIGRAILNLNPKTYYKNTSISVTAEGGVPSVSATAKVNKEEENEY